MEIIDASAKEYAMVFANPYHSYNLARFNEINRDKCDDLKFLLFRSGKIRLGLIAGITDGVLSSPFSAPFGGFSFLDPGISIVHIEEAFNTLTNYCALNGYKKITFLLPPAFYQETFLSKIMNVAYRSGYRAKIMELNHAFFLEDFTDQYQDKIITYSARKNLKTSLNSELDFHIGKNDEDFRTAYDVIALNRRSKGFVLRMSFDQMLQTSRIIRADHYTVSHKSIPVASSIVFHVSDHIVQVIYWGDDPEFTRLRPMNFLPYKMFEYYKTAGMKVVDIGPSSQQSVPMQGLVDFKESIGCRVHLKYTITKEISGV